MKRFSFGATLLLVGAAAMALAGMQGYKLKRTAKEGDVTKYKMSGELEVMGQTVGFSATMVNKTIKVESNGDYLVEGSQLDAKINLGGSEMDVRSGSQGRGRRDGRLPNGQPDDDDRGRQGA
jgi:hypothetical protein